MWKFDLAFRAEGHTKEAAQYAVELMLLELGQQVSKAGYDVNKDGILLGVYKKYNSIEDKYIYEGRWHSWEKEV